MDTSDVTGYGTILPWIEIIYRYDRVDIRENNARLATPLYRQEQGGR